MVTWTWRFEKSDGSEVQPPLEPEEFSTQGDAESWVGEYWQDLQDGGVDQVRLFEDTTEIYGPMSLHPESTEGAEDSDDTADAAQGGESADA